MPAGIVLGYDDSAGARAALPVAIDLACRLGEPLHIAFAALPPTKVGEEARVHTQALEEMGAALMAEALAAAQAAGAETVTHIGHERPAELLIDLADAHDARVIVVGTYGEHPLRGAILGSTPYRLLHLSARPVLAVPEVSAAR